MNQEHEKPETVSEDTLTELTEPIADESAPTADEVMPPVERENPPTGEKKRFTLSFLLSVVSIVMAVTILCTHTVTVILDRAYYRDKLAEQQATIDRLYEQATLSELDVWQIDALAAIFESYGYYADKVDQETLLNAVMKAYAEATGDRYAEYYTEEEYAALTADNVGEQVGIGVSVMQSAVTVEGVEYAVFQIIGIHRGSPAYETELQIGDCIYAFRHEGEIKTVSSMGYGNALNAFTGPAGSVAEFSALRRSGEGYQTLEFSITRAPYETSSVTYSKLASDPTVGIVQISSFDLTTPSQLKEAVKALQSDGAEHFVFDVRNNPGGDLQSIKATLTYFLQPDDLILSSVNRNGETVRSYYANAMTLSGDYAACNVAEEEVGMFADLDMVVLCNENTASAAEVFTATLYDYGLATVVGETTFGKGIMQTFFALSSINKEYRGYAKMTTYAYVTKRGTTYHEIGVEPHEKVSLSDEAKSYNFYLLPQEKDDQLQAAIQYFE